MANSPSAEKRTRQNARRRERNRSARSRLRTAVKRLRAEVEAGNKAAAEALLPSTCSLVDSTAGKGVIHANTAARTKSRLARAVAALD
jgi:small subunit ribosomal protein S20